MAGIPQWQHAATKMQDALSRNEVEIINLRGQSKLANEQIDEVRTTSLPELQERVRALEAQIAVLHDRVNWSRDIWKALALIVVTAVISAIVVGIKEVLLRP